MDHTRSEVGVPTWDPEVGFKGVQGARNCMWSLVGIRVSITHFLGRVHGFHSIFKVDQDRTEDQEHLCDDELTAFTTVSVGRLASGALTVKLTRRELPGPVRAERP